MQTALLIAQIVIGLALSILILMQEKGSGLGDAIAGGSQQPILMKKRGSERFLALLTVVLLAVFLGLSIALNFVG